MRVLTVSEPGLDGVFRHVEGLVHYLVEQGVEVDLAWSSRRPSADLYALVEFVNEHGGKTLDLGVGPMPGPRDLVALTRLWSLATHREPDIIHGHSSKAGALVRLLAPLLSGPQFLYTPHAYFGLDGRRGLKTRLFHAVESLLGSTCPTIHVSTDEREFGIHHFGLDPDSCHTLVHGVDSTRFCPPGDARREELRTRYGLDSAQIVLGTIGRIGPQKDYPTLYRALAPVFATRPELRLLQVGSGPDVDAIQLLAREVGLADSIVAVDFLDRAEDFYQAVDLVVMTSVYEAGIPYVALEALACGLPLVATGCPGLRTLEEHGFDALEMATTGDPEDVRRAVLNQLGSGLDRGNNHRELILAGFTLDQARQRVLESYSSTLGRHVKGTVTLLS